MEYLDEAGNDPPTGESTEEHNKSYVVSSFTIKKFYLEGVQFFTDEFPSRARTFSRSVMSQSQSQYDSAKEDEFFSRIIDDESPKSKRIIPENDCFMSCTDLDDQENSVPDERRRFSLDEHEPILFGKLSGRQEVIQHNFNDNIR